MVRDNEGATYRSAAVDGLNQLYVLTALSVTGLKNLRDDIYSTKRRTVPIEVVTRHGQTIATTKRRAKVKDLIDRAVSSDLYRTALVGAVVLVEDFLQAYLQMILLAYPKKIGKDKRIGVDELLAARDKDHALQLLISKEILSAMYKSPREYLAYFETTLSISLPDELKEAYVEIKATRDLLVHNGGRINQVYVDKTEKHARGRLNEDIEVTKTYFDSSITILKDITHVTFERVLEKHGDARTIMKPNQPLHPDAFGASAPRRR